VRTGAALAALAAAIVLVFAGCGGGGRLSKSEYEQKLQAQGETLRSAFKGTDISNSGNLKEISAKIATLQAKLEKAADEIDALDPPKDAEADNRKIADALHKFANEFGKMKKAAQSGDPKRMQQIEQEISTAREVKDAQDATADLKRKGYKVGSLGQ
jgi:predicted  nucleic acid-binding Zn-ribbon protein